MIRRLYEYLSILLHWSRYQRSKMDFLNEVAAFTAGKETEYPLMYFWIHYVTARFRLRFEGAQKTFRVLQSGFDAHPDTFWATGEAVLSDIQALVGVEFAELPSLFERVRDVSSRAQRMNADSFEQVCKELYNHPLYPVSEHLPYAAGGSPVERLVFLDRYLVTMGKEAMVCDVGFGPGMVLARILASHPCWRGYGVDISPACLDYARRLLTRYGVSDRAELRVGDVRQLPYTDSFFDVVIANEVLEHIPDPQTGLAEIVRVLKPGGCAILGLPLRMGGGMHLVEFQSPEDIQGLCHRAGLSIQALDLLPMNLRWGGSTDDTADVFVFCTKPQVCAQA